MTTTSVSIFSTVNEASENAPLFIEAFYNACKELERRNPRMEIPGVGHINRILTDAGSSFQIDPPKLIATRAHVPIAVVKRTCLTVPKGRSRSLETVSYDWYELNLGKGALSVTG